MGKVNMAASKAVKLKRSRAKSTPKGFKVGEGVLVFEPRAVYDAKIIQARQLDGKQLPMYFVTYFGWGSKYNEWVSADSVFKNTAKNQDLKRKVLAKLKSVKQKTNKGNKVKEELEEKDEELEQFMSQQAFRSLEFSITEDTKKLLVADWEKVTQKRMLVQIPKKKSVKAILSEFRKSHKGKDSSNKDLDYILDGLESCFEQSIGSILLYHFERLQYDNIAKDDSLNKLRMSEIYGGEHLLRLLVKLPEMFDQVDLSKTADTLLQKVINELQKFLMKNKEKYFGGSYSKCEDEYLSIYDSNKI
mmetsp:Transcript_20396/g.26459  ORF Transcript_20396/g.26459 Transcript_20396/m.26459 type:complete len:303 (+) Transcript_20396:193-1101(+)